MNTDLEPTTTAEVHALIARLQELVGPGPLAADGYGNPGAVASGELIESAWGNQVRDRVVRRFPTKANADAASAVPGHVATVTGAPARLYLRNESNQWANVVAGGLRTLADSNTVYTSWTSANGTWPMGDTAIVFSVDGTVIFGVAPNGKIFYGMNGTTGQIKTFVIDHPDDPDRYLIHACAEGPTADVFYRGVADLGDDEVTVTLPDYFDTLTVPDTATVHLTPLHQPARLAADPPKASAFTVRGDPCRFWWQVTAQRAGTDFDPEPVRDTVRVHGHGPYRWHETEEN